MSYCYDRVISGSIRLLTLKRSHDGKTFDGLLTSHSLRQLPPFDALSYTWGVSESRNYISIGDDSGHRGWLEILPNLELAMKRLVASGESKVVWIDQICINQQDDNDKSTQVEVMGDIYQAANNVIVYLGEPVLDFHPEHGILSDILHCLARIDGLVVITDANFRQLGLPSKDDPVWSFLAEVLASPWFERLWTLQEVVLASNIRMQFGRHSLQWDVWLSLSHALLKAHLHPFICSRLSSPSSRLAGIPAFTHVHLLRNSRVRGNVHLVQILEVARTKKCGLPIDRIYASRGMMSDRARHLIEVDYAKSAHAAYIQTCTLIIQADPTFWVLSSVGARSHFVDLPSWCPDLDVLPPENPLSTFGPLARYHAGFSIPPETLDFCEYIATRLDTRNLPKSFPDSNGIVVLGMSVDIVKTVSNFQWRWPQPDESEIAQQTIEWEIGCLSTAQATFQSDKSVPEEHWRCLIANKLQSNQPCIADLHEHYNEMIRYLNLVADSQIPSQHLSGDDISRILNFGLAVDYACKGRRYFSTRDGRVGLGPASCRIGDLVCVFHNAPVPYILRRDDSRGSQGDDNPVMPYTFIGESYVHGLMSAEAFNLRDAGKLTEEKFLIE